MYKYGRSFLVSKFVIQFRGKQALKQNFEASNKTLLMDCY